MGQKHLMSSKKFWMITWSIKVTHMSTLTVISRKNVLSSALRALERGKFSFVGR